MTGFAKYANVLNEMLKGHIEHFVSKHFSIINHKDTGHYTCRYIQGLVKYD